MFSNYQSWLDKKFIVVRYSPGSGGKFFGCLLQLSPDVNSWDTELDHAKISNNHETIFEYFTKKFNADYENWLLNEPAIPYQLARFNHTAFPVGEDLTLPQALQQLENDSKWQEHYNNHKRILLILNKSRIPTWMIDSCTMVNLHINDLYASKWVNRAMASKLFIQTEPEKFDFKLTNAKWVGQERAELAQKHVKKTQWQGSWYSFVKTCIVNTPTNVMFRKIDKILNDPSNQQIPQQFFPIGSIRCAKTYVEHLGAICRNLGIQKPHEALTEKIVQYYIDLHWKK